MRGCAQGDGPSRGATDKKDDFSPPHSIILSARATVSNATSRAIYVMAPGIKQRIHMEYLSATPVLSKYIYTGQTMVRPTLLGSATTEVSGTSIHTMTLESGSLGIRTR
jgi:hypothetical protein